jgi:perosamine synthetase
MIPYGRHGVTQADIDAVCEVLASDFLTTGPCVERFEQALCALTGAKHAVACSNGTTALHLACLALGVQEDDRGITSPLTFLASANCIEFCRGKTDFVDIDPLRLCLSVELLDEYCRSTAVPKLVVAVDYAGMPADLPAIRALSARHGFAVIEDAAHAIGSTYTDGGENFACGSCRHSDCAVFSFHPVKTITTGEGGAVMTNDGELAARLRLMRNHGMTKDEHVLSRNDGPWYYEMHEVGYNYRITDIQCALGISQLSRLGEFKERRASIVRRYTEAFESHPRLVVPASIAGTEPCHHLYPLRFAEGAQRRAAAYKALVERDIHPQVHYIPVHLQPYYSRKYGYEAGKCPVAETFYEQCLSLPLYAGFGGEGVDEVIQAVMSALE